MYRTVVPSEALAENSELTFAGSVNDVATVRRVLSMLMMFMCFRFRHQPGPLFVHSSSWGFDMSSSLHPVHVSLLCACSTS